MKIYMVEADNGWDYEDHRNWNERAFTSKESAEKFIEEYTKEILAAIDREKELEDMLYERAGGSWGGWKKFEEFEEYERVHDLACTYWHFFDKGGFYIGEYDLDD